MRPGDELAGHRDILPNTALNLGLAARQHVLERSDPHFVGGDAELGNKIFVADESPQ